MNATTKISSLVSVAAGFILVSAVTPARADWDPSQPAKWYQLPDLTNGMDVLDTYNPQLPYNKILADDFLCTMTGQITDIHIWGSWLNDRLPRDPGTGDPIPPTFHLSFHSDIPATPTSHSRPGALLWQADLVPNQQRIYATASERFFDPNINQIIGFDTQVWQYNFFLPPALAFTQDVGNIYWLDVQVQPQPFGDALGPYRFGWKTSFQHFNDDAVFGDNITFGGVPTDWNELRDPVTHQSLDLAFVLTTSGIPEPMTLMVWTVLAGMAFVLRKHIQFNFR